MFGHIKNITMLTYCASSRCYSASGMDEISSSQIIMLEVANVSYTGMSFCRGSVNCHGSDGQMYHFCESSRSGEIFLDQYRGGGGSLFPVINSSESAYFVA